MTVPPCSDRRRWQPTGDALDLADPAFHLNPDSHHVLAHLAATEPVRWNAGADGTGFWAVTGHDCARAVLADTRTFSSDWRLGGFRIFDLQAVTATPRPVLLSLDGPAHLSFRRALLPLFGTDSITRLQAGIERRAHTLVRQLGQQDTADFVSDLALPLTTGLMLDLIGAEAHIEPRLGDWIELFVGDEDPEFRATPAARSRCVADFEGWAQQQFAQRREHPGTDFISRLLTVQIAGRPLDFDGLTANLGAFLVAARETSRHAMATAMMHFDQAPRLRQSYVRQASLRPQIVKELLRLAAPLIHTRRTVTRDTTLAGQQLRRGARVVVWLGAANRDPSVFAAPHALTTTPGEPGHLAFGHGPHFCMGWRLAELQIEALFTQLLTACPDVRVDGCGRRLRSNFLYGWKSLPIRLSAVPGPPAEAS